ncbi:MAG: sigma-70 family RNA polymerase sigma factor [Candidatus Solibacter sp.]|nr:sigma-70 family RNA polymerase sigma factor [Candidatus Solibacter sp.]
MGTRAASDVTGLLAAWKGGNEEAFRALMPLVYGELRRIAASHLRRERPDHTLQPTALIHEAYLRMVGGQQPQWEDRVHFFGIASRLMRNILVDAARKNRAEKRGGGAKEQLEDLVVVAPERGFDLVRLDDALKDLGRFDERKCQAIEMKYFGGLSRDEIASALGTSPASVGRDLRFAEAWLRRELLAPQT